ncbi:HAD family hydrolase [Plantactinospora sp. GCM10030261]|uniref:HAD family hydrolase n=1 Tax=Plantactinospora sp. GCM10030261 TaxID=3273420 RepID=UPI00360A1CCE
MSTPTGRDRRFPVVVCGGEITDPKPAPEGLSLTCQRLAVDVADAAYVGDAEVDRRAHHRRGPTPAPLTPGRTILDQRHLAPI